MVEPGGDMRKHVTKGGPRSVRALEAWLKGGASESTFNRKSLAAEGDPSADDVIARHCLRCHNAEDGEKADAPYGPDLFTTDYGMIYRFAAPGSASPAPPLGPGGRFLIWVYGREGNGSYILFTDFLRRLTRLMPDFMLAGLTHVLNALLGVYVFLCRYLPLPLAQYMREVMSKFERRKRFFLIFDQLNCGYAKYYTRQEAYDLLSQAGFRNVRLYHRHGMSWTAIGETPATQAVTYTC